MSNVPVESVVPGLYIYTWTPPATGSAPVYYRTEHLRDGEVVGLYLTVFLRTSFYFVVPGNHTVRVRAVDSLAREGEWSKESDPVVIERHRDIKPQET
jgi:hypothetical protein